MPFKPYGRENYAVWRTLDGFGRVGPFSTCQSRKALAQQIEDLWVSLPRLGFSDLVQAVVDGRIALSEVWTAHMNGGLVGLREEVNGTREETVKQAVDLFLPYVTDDRIRVGLHEVVTHAGDKPWVWLASTQGVRVTLAAALDMRKKRKDGTEAKRAPNSVRRSVWRALNDLLVHRLGNAERRRILADVKAPGKKRLLDRNLTPDQITTLLDTFDVEIKPLVTAALLTGIDRGPLLAMRVKHFGENSGTLYVPDTKTEARERVLDLSEMPTVLALFRKACSGKQPEDQIFPFTPGQVVGRFRRARIAAKLPWLRFKDLRHVFATKWIEAGGDIRTLQQWLGHSTYQTTMIYVGTVMRTGATPAAKAVELMGQGGPILKIERVS